MDESIVPIPRFWTNPSSLVQLDLKGYLADPESSFPSSENAQISPVNIVGSAIPCLILLGEPGIGKSSTLDTAKTADLGEEGNLGASLLWIDMREIGSATDLYRHLFDLQEIQSWKEGTSTLELFLDGFDECRAQVSNVADSFALELRRWPKERLRLRIACRTADWPETFTGELKAIWGQDNVHFRELLPLRKRDVATIVSARNVELEPFFEAVDRVSAASLATKPLTLDFLVRTFKDTGALPTNQAELFREGCLLLCSDTQHKRDTQTTGHLSREQRLAVAKRIAALTIFSNSGKIAIADLPGSDADAISLSSLSGSTEEAHGNRFAILPTEISETLGTGLFSARGEAALGWAHQSYAEYLAAEYVAANQRSLAQILSLITTAETETAFVPQLQGTIVWLATLRPDVARCLGARQPELLLQCNDRVLDPGLRATATESLLREAKSGEWVDTNWGIRNHYSKLAHPGLASQLRPFLTDSSINFVAQRVAIHIAEECHVDEVAPDLIKVALDADCDIHARVSACYAITNIGQASDCAALKPLVSIPPDEDFNLELRGCGLRACWPDHLTATEFFAALVPPPTNFFGAFTTFIENAPFAHVSLANYPEMFAWALSHFPKPGGTSNFELTRLIDQAIMNGIGKVEKLSEDSGLGKLLWMRIRHPHGFLDQQDLYPLPTSTRQQALRWAISASDHAEAVFAFAVPSVWKEEDIPWILEQYKIRPDPERRVWGELCARLLVGVGSSAALNAAWDAKESDPTLASYLEPFFGHFELGTARANELKSRWYRWRAADDDPPPRSETELATEAIVNIDRLLSASEAGDKNAWWHLNYVLFVDPASRLLGGELESDLTLLPYWPQLWGAFADRILSSAVSFITGYIPSPKSWMYPDQKVFLRPDLAGIRAFRLLHENAPDTLLALPDSTWKAWTVALVGFRELNWGAGKRWQQEVIREAYERSPKLVLDTLKDLVLAHSKTPNPEFARLFWEVEQCWDEAIAAVFCSQLATLNLDEIGLRQLFAGLLSHNHVATQQLGKALVTPFLAAETETRERTAAIVATLWQHNPTLYWAETWPLVEQDHKFAETVFDELVWNEDRSASIAKHLDDAQLADLYILVSTMYPPKGDRLLNGEVVTYRDAVGEWRDALLRELSGRGTISATNQIERLRNALPSQSWLVATKHIARLQLYHDSWSPPTIEEIRALLSSAESRLIVSRDHLLEVVLESLQRLEERLQRQNSPAAFCLWNEEGKRAWPKDEERLSDLLTQHLNDDLCNRGIVFNREVVAYPGNENDVYVTAIQTDDSGSEIRRHELVIEVKGCWHSELKTALKGQLVEQYIQGSHLTHGLYVVGWFMCDKWDSSDWRYVRTPKLSIPEIQSDLDAQALAESVGGRVIRARVLDTSLHH